MSLFGTILGKPKGLPRPCARASGSSGIVRCARHGNSTIWSAEPTWFVVSVSVWYLEWLGMTDAAQRLDSLCTKMERL